MLELPANNKKRGEGEEQPWHLSDEGDYDDYYWRIRYFCYCAADGEPRLTNEMYNDWPLGDIYDIVTLGQQRAVRPPPKPEGGKNGIRRSSRP
jgi:hypothetical protein